MGDRSIIKIAVIGDRSDVDQWFLREGLQTDMLRVAERRTTIEDGAVIVERFVAEDDDRSPEWLTRYDEVIEAQERRAT